MASELRTIILTQDEIIQSLTEIRKRRGNPLPPGTVFKYAVHAHPRIEASLAIAVAGEDRLESFTFLADELGAAIVMYCMTHNIPLPAKGATKALRMVGDSLALVVSRNATTEMLQEFLDVH